MYRTFVQSHKVIAELVIIIVVAFCILAQKYVLCAFEMHFHRILLFLCRSLHLLNFIMLH